MLQWGPARTQGAIFGRVEEVGLSGCRGGAEMGLGLCFWRLEGNGRRVGFREWLRGGVGAGARCFEEGKGVRAKRGLQGAFQGVLDTCPQRGLPNDTPAPALHLADGALCRLWQGLETCVVLLQQQPRRWGAAGRVRAGNFLLLSPAHPNPARPSLGVPGCPFSALRSGRCTYDPDPGNEEQQDRYWEAHDVVADGVQDSPELLPARAPEHAAGGTLRRGRGGAVRALTPRSPQRPSRLLLGFTDPCQTPLRRSSQG